MLLKISEYSKSLILVSTRNQKIWKTYFRVKSNSMWVYEKKSPKSIIFGEYSQRKNFSSLKGKLFQTFIKGSKYFEIYSPTFNIELWTFEHVSCNCHLFEASISSTTVLHVGILSTISAERPLYQLRRRSVLLLPRLPAALRVWAFRCLPTNWPLTTSWGIVYHIIRRQRFSKYCRELPGYCTDSPLTISYQQ